MVETQVKFVVVGHHTRIGHAQRLAALLGAHLLIDDGDHGANWNHRRALEWAACQPCRVVVLEDDAMPVPWFAELVVDWLTRFPDDMLSFYLGTGRPPQYQMQIAERLIVADKAQADYITLPRLIFNTSGVQLSTYSDPRSRFVNGEQFLNYVINKMITADGVTAAQKTYILWSGDSTIVGVNSEAWPPASIANFYAKRYGILDVQNTALGHSGKTLYEWGYFYIDTEWAQHAAADLIVLRWGINDPMVGPYTLAQCKDALDRGLSKLRANKTVAQQSIIIMAPNSTSDTPNGRDEKWYEQLTAMLRAKAKQYKCMFFDTYGLFQDSRGAAGIWLDDPYGDGRGIHPNAAFSAQIHDKLFEHIYGPCAVINGSSNLFSNNGSSLQFVNGAYPPNTFSLGQSWWRTNPSDSSWPVDGVIQVDRFVDGVVVMRLYGYTSEQTRVCYTRMARATDTTWSSWRGLRTDITTAMLSNGWTAAAARSATYQKSDDGVVTIDAMLVPGTVTANTTIFTLPVGYRPKNNISYIACGANNGYASVNITTGGAVQINSLPASATVLTLNISFPSLVV